MKKQAKTNAMHEVRVFDGQGNLKEIIQPVFDYEAKAIGKTTNKKCPECKKISKFKGNQKFCGTDCARASKCRKEKAMRKEKKHLKMAKPIVPCEICEEPVTGTKIKYCSNVCDQKARKLKSKKKQEETNARIKIRREEIRHEESRC